MEPALRQHRENRIAEPTMQDGHRARHDLATARRQTASLHQVITLAHLFEEARNLLEVVTAIGITHDDEATARRGYAAHQGTAITTLRDEDYSRAEACLDVLRPVGAAVVRHNQFSRDAIFTYRSLRLLDTFCQRVGLVEAGNDYAKFDFRGMLVEPVSQRIRICAVHVCGRTHDRLWT